MCHCDSVTDATLSPLLDLATDLCANLAAADRYDRLLAAVRRMVPCDAACLLELAADGLHPVVQTGLHPDVLGLRFVPAEHPRLDAILRAGRPVRFATAELPDPFDGLLLAGGRDALHRVHACMGAPLVVEGAVVGALTVDALDPTAFDPVTDATVATLAALAGAALRTARLVDTLEALLRRQGLVAHELSSELRARRGGEILGEAEPIRRVKREMELVAGSDLTVLITGETGVGKELVARGIHAASSRKDEALVYVNCAALPESIAESELFGHVKGAFTGASGPRAGKFEAAHRGTLFLDEVGELPLTVQPKLLRALQSGDVQRVGSDAPIHADVRVIAATNRDLAASVRDGRFRADLYHRLSVYPLRVPALRERLTDVPLLAGFFLDRARLQLGCGPLRLTPAARDALLGYRWPGNVRELEHVLLRAALRAAETASGGPVLVHARHVDLGAEAALAAPAPSPAAAAHEVDAGLSLGDATDAFRRRLVADTLAASDGNWSEAARRLGVDRGNLYRLGRRLGLIGSGSRAG
ncbi:MAG: nitric oxide reductase transcriptional regulator NorR [Deltaproteobacteria bacterium HGW-Deltaproteobacteria-14]|jgi:anaerobic nitric oxide reductase transcription regulator|nr:MAG: nitric oxide reductase transcriptional regulator NorR [Deltaproteobacteria bacterium HGW-Deltaproteobacteria-14]